MDNNCVNGIKEGLIKEFSELKKVHGVQWRPILRKQYPWHNTLEGLYAWQNANKGTAGNETLRRIISDMKAITELNSPKRKQIMTRQKLTTKTN